MQIPGYQLIFISQAINMRVKSVAERIPPTPSIIEFLESRARLTGLVREIYIARGWIKPTGFAEQHYQVTPKGAHIFQSASAQKRSTQ